MNHSLKGPMFDSVNMKDIETSFFQKKEESPDSSDSPVLLKDSLHHGFSEIFAIFKETENQQIFASKNEITTQTPKNQSPNQPKSIENNLILPIVKNFIMKLKNASAKRSINELTRANFTILNDSSFFIAKAQIFNKNGPEKMFLTLKTWFEPTFENLKNFVWSKKIRKFFKNHITVLYPYQTIKILWDILHLIVIIYWFFYIPLFLVFSEIHDLEENGSMVTVVFLIFDIFIKFNTAYFKNGVIERRRWKIFRNYSRNQLKFDLLTLLPILLDSMLGESNEYNTLYLHLMKFAFFLKMSTCQEISGRILERFMIKEKWQCIMDLFKTFCVSFLVAHLFACFWYMTANYSFSFYNVSWLSKADLLDASWQTKYIYSFYWASVTMMTVGYGDIVPQNENEVIICIFSVVLGCVVYAYNLNSIGTILQKFNRENVEFNNKINIINQFMYRKNIHRDLQRRIREYLSFLWKEENTQNIEEEHKIIEYLSGSLKEELYLEAYGSLLNKDPIFFTNFSEKSLRKIVSKVKEIRLFPDEKVFFQGEEDDFSFFYVLKGEVELFSKNGNKEIPLSKVSVGNHFGELSFFTGTPHAFSARSKDFTTLLSINRAEFLKVLEKHQEDFEKFFMIKDEILLYNNFNPLRVRCFCCNKIGHVVTKCDLIHFIPDNEKVIKKFTYYLDQPRNRLFVRKDRKNNALILKKTLNKVCKKIVDNLIKSTTWENEDNSSNEEIEDEEVDEFDAKIPNPPIEKVQKIFLPNGRETMIKEELSTTNIRESSTNTKIETNGENLTLKKLESGQKANSSELSSSYEEIKETKDKEFKEKDTILRRNHALNRNYFSSDQLNKMVVLPSKEFIKKKTIFKEKPNMESQAINSNDNIQSYSKLDKYSCEIYDLRKNFKNYFPEQNCNNVLGNFNKNNMVSSLGKIKENQRKMLEKKFKLGKYSFYVNEMMKKMFSTNKKRKSFLKRKKRNGFSGELPMFSIRSGKETTTSARGGGFPSKFSDVVKMVMLSPVLKKHLKIKK